MRCAILRDKENLQMVLGEKKTIPLHGKLYPVGLQ
jgi:hypothetical protein